MRTQPTRLARRFVPWVVMAVLLVAFAPSAALLAVAALNVWYAKLAISSFAAPPAGIESKDGTTRDRVVAAYAGLPIGFEPNVGQTDASVDFVARGSGYTAFLTRTGATLVMRQRSSPTAVVVRMDVVGGESNARGAGHDPLAARAHYLVGSDEARWRRGVPVYARVNYRNVYPGVDLVFHGRRGHLLECDFVVAPGTPPDVIRLAFRGAARPVVDAVGDLIIATAAGELRLPKPVVYQEEAGVKRTIRGDFIVTPAGDVTFGLDSYDRARPLVIDPVISYGTYLGGSSADEAFAVTVDTAGNAYVTGNTTSTNFPTTAGVLQDSLVPGIDAFVAKLNATGSGLAYSTYLGGTDTDGGRAIAVDASGNAFVAGFTESSDFPTTAGVFQATSGGGRDAFLAKLNSTGSQLVYSTFLGGSGSDVALGLAVDSAGSAYLVGGTFSANFPLRGVFPAMPAGGREGFVSKINASGTDLVYSRHLRGSGDDVVNAITVDSSGIASVAGFTASSNLPTVGPSGPFQTTFGGGATDAFVARLNADGSVLYTTYLGGSGNDEVTGIAIDSAGTAYVAGNSASTDFPLSSGSLSLSTFGFVTRLDAFGGALLYSRAIPGLGVAAGVAVDAAARAHVVGSRGSCTATSPPSETDSPFQFECTGPQTDAVLAKMNAPGTAETYMQILGGSALENGEAIALDAAGSAYVTGRTESNDFPATPGAFQVSRAGLDDLFLTKITDVQGVVNPGGREGGGGRATCAVSTAAFGSPLAAEVEILRRFRDRVLLTGAPGQALVRLYYRVSPPLARVVASNGAVRWATRLTLRPLVMTAAFALASPGFALAAGSVIALAGAGMLIVGVVRRRRIVVRGLLMGGAFLVLLAVVSRPPAPRLEPATAVDDAPSRVAAGRDSPSLATSTAPAVGAVPPVRPDGVGVSRTDLQTLSRRLPDLSVSIVPLPLPTRMRFWIRSPMVEAVMDSDGLSVIEPKELARFGIEPGDRIRSLDGWPLPGILVVLHRLARDPDAVAVRIELERH